MAKTLIFTDTSRNSAHAANWNTAKAAVQNVIDLYDDLSLPALATGELSTLVNNTDALIFNKMTGGDNATLAFGEGEDAISLPISTGQASELIDKPAGYNTLITAIKELSRNSLAGWGAASFNIASIGQCFIIDGSGDLQFSTSVTTLISGYGKYYISTQIAKNMFAFAGDVVDAFFDNDLHESLSYLPGAPKIDLRQILDIVIASIDVDGETFIPNYEALTIKDNSLKGMGFVES